MTDQARDEAERLAKIWDDWKRDNCFAAEDRHLAAGFSPTEMKSVLAYGFHAGEKSEKVMRLVEALKNMPCEFVSLLAGSGPASVHDDGCRKCKTLESFNASSDGGG